VLSRHSRENPPSGHRQAALLPKGEDGASLKLGK